jgi:hypothetical protein
VTVKAPLGVCIIGAAMGWALVAGCLYANSPGHATDAWTQFFDLVGLYPPGLFALVMTVLTVRFAFVRRVPPGTRTIVNAVLAGLEVLVVGVLLSYAAVVFFGRT